MMMAYDSGPTRNSGLSAAVVDQVANALTGYLMAPNGQSDQLRAALQELARDAREKGMPPEKLLIVLKDVWYALPVVRDSTERDEQVRLLQRVVTMCISEYYRE
jgi:hypothetical protein